MLSSASSGANSRRKSWLELHRLLSKPRRCRSMHIPARNQWSSSVWVLVHQARRSGSRWRLRLSLAASHSWLFEGLSHCILSSTSLIWNNPSPTHFLFYCIAWLHDCLINSTHRANSTHLINASDSCIRRPTSILPLVRLTLMAPCRTTWVLQLRFSFRRIHKSLCIF